MLNALIFNCLLEQLQTTDKAIVPELGTFTVTTASASLNYVTNRFDPPHKTVTFSSQHDKDDESLVSLLASRQHVTEEEARTFIHDFAESVKQMLQSDGKIDLDDLGTLVKNDEEIVLVEKPSVRLFNDDIGFDAFTASLLTKKVEKQILEEPQESEEQPKSDETPIDISIADDDLPVEHHRSIFKPLLLVILIAAILFGLSWYTVKYYPEIAKKIPFFYLSPNEYLASRDVQPVPQPETPVAPQPIQPTPQEPYIDELSILDDFLSIDSLAASVDTTEIHVIDTQATHSPTVPDTVVSITDQHDEMPQLEEYYIVVASSRNREEVEPKSKKYIEQGFLDTQIVYNEERRSYRVVVESYSHAATANQRLREIRKTVCPEAWIFHQEKH